MIFYTIAILLTLFISAMWIGAACNHHEFPDIHSWQKGTRALKDSIEERKRK